MKRKRQPGTASDLSRTMTRSFRDCPLVLWRKADTCPVGLEKWSPRGVPSVPQYHLQTTIRQRLQKETPPDEGVYPLGLNRLNRSLNNTGVAPYYSFQLPDFSFFFHNFPLYLFARGEKSWRHLSVHSPTLNCLPNQTPTLSPSVILTGVGDINIGFTNTWNELYTASWLSRTLPRFS